MTACQTQPRMLRVLVADDRPDVLQALRLLLKAAGHQAVTVDSPQALLAAAQTRAFDIILMDLNYARDTTSGQEGLDLLERLHERQNPAPVIVMTAWGNIDLAVEAMRRGASDFIQKPWDNARLLATVEKQARESAGRREAERLARSELEIARNVQNKLFPQRTKPLASVVYGGRCVPAHDVGGDYYDFLDLGPGRLGFVLADVSGKGIGAALLMANLQGCFRSQCERPPERPSELLRAVNRLFFDSTPAEQYATLFFGDYDDGARRLRYVNCGHPPPMLLRRDGHLERLETGATVVGIFPDWSCEEGAVALEPGDALAIVSDGVTEAGIEADNELGEERVAAMLRAGGDQPVGAMVDGLIELARGFGQSDDITVVGIRAVNG